MLYLYGLLGRLRSACMSAVSDMVRIRMCANKVNVVVVVLLFYVHGKHLRSCWDGQLT